MRDQGMENVTDILAIDRIAGIAASGASGLFNKLGSRLTGDKTKAAEV
jgi:hypothetical protein